MSQPPDPAQYEAFAQGYEAHADVGPYNRLYDQPATLRLLGDVAGRRVLDAACGPGFYLEQLVERGADVVGCDAAPTMIELARARVGEGVELHVHRLEDPFAWVEDASVDVVLCALAYHYLNDRTAFLREAARMLRPGGAVVISTHHPTSDWARLGGSYFTQEPVVELWSPGWEVTTWRIPLTTLTEEFADAGFVIERLVEPLPEPEMARTSPGTFEKLSNRPDFILFRLRYL